MNYVAGEDIKQGDQLQVGQDGKLYKVLSLKIKRIPQEDFYKSIKENPAYKHINIDQELKLMDEWIKRHPGRQKTRTFVLGWLGRKEVPLNFNTTNKIAELMKK